MFHAYKLGIYFRWANVVLTFKQWQIALTGFPLGLEKLENLEKREGIFQSGKSQGILNRLEKSGKTTQNTGKLRKFQKKLFVIFQWYLNELCIIC